MAAFKILNLLAATTLAIVACSFSATPVNALSVESGHHVARHFRPHGSIMKKRQNSRRCKPRPSDPPVAQPTPTVLPLPPAEPTPPTNDQPNNNGDDGDDTGTDQPPPPPPTENLPPSIPPPSSGGRKAGIATAGIDDDALRHMAGPGIGWLMNWSPWRSEIIAELGIEYCAMLWGEKQIGEFQTLVVPGYTNCILGFNEPNQPGQADMDPNWAAQVWRDYIQPLKSSGAQLISPACTNAPSAIDWYNTFFSACSDCSFDGLATHFYGTSADELIAHITNLHDMYGMQIWLTEYACQDFGDGAQCDEGQTWSFHQTVKGFMDSTPWVTAYFPFGAMYDMSNVNPLNQLLGPDGYPTALGGYYIS